MAESCHGNRAKRGRNEVLSLAWPHPALCIFQLWGKAAIRELKTSVQEYSQEQGMKTRDWKITYLKSQEETINVSVSVHQESRCGHKS